MNNLRAIWQGIKARTAPYNTHHEAYTRYAGRGITMYDSWRLNYDEFEAYILSELGERPTDKHSLDRIDNDKGYQPSNLRWATPKQQNSNTTRSIAHAAELSVLYSVASVEDRNELRQLTGISRRMK